MTLYIGIDPGASGAIAGIDELGNVCMLHDWPGDEIQAAKIFWDIVDYGEEHHERFATLFLRMFGPKLN